MLLVGGCVGVFSSSPPDNVEFASVTDLHQLDGRYRNRGEGAPDAQWTTYLSALIFPGDTALDHGAIESIHVRATSATGLAVRALDARGVVIKESGFVRGREFELEEGRLRIRTRFAVSPFVENEAPDNPFVGPMKETVELGIDLRGHGKYRSSTFVAGLVYLFMPIVVGGSDQVRFERFTD
jgi:hypothetical protein